MNTTKKLMTMLLALLGFSQVIAQEYEYVPFVREGVKWMYYIRNYDYYWDYYTNPARGDNVAYRTFEMRGDTVINGKTYKAVHKYSGDAINEEQDTIPVFLREEDKIVYAILPDVELFYSDCPIGNPNVYNDGRWEGEEFLLYDFQDPIGYWTGIEGYLNLQVDTVIVGDHLAKRYVGDYADFCVVEGVGAMGFCSYPLAAFMDMAMDMHGSMTVFEKVVENGEVIYPQNFVEDRYLPVIREGVKWVFEKVTVHDGDTTCQYYTYEFKGNHPVKDKYNRTYKALYRYDGCYHEIDVKNDSLVAGLREDESIVIYEYNEPLKACISQERDMINFNGCLYDMSLNLWWCRENYINYQREPFLNDENFVKAEPIIIDGYRCSRLAYLNEQGDTLAYVVEGIGFDSYDMGDLLTPFTRKPDHNADYQEWCGLSHVIKNGKIIYKGMRYRPYIPGDVNGDGEITVADAGSVIDVVIMGGNAGHTRIPAADVNGDGEVNVADVNAIIDMILSNY